MRVLVACEFSGIVRDAFIARGHDAWSCDLLPCETGEPHIEDDVWNHVDEGWDLMIAHPPCTFLTVSANKWMGHPRFPHRERDRADAIEFFMSLITAPIAKICVENPIGIMSTQYRKPDQIIQPWQFGHPETKATCLWLKGLPKLVPTNIVSLPEKESERMRLHYLPPSKNRWKERSRTFTGIAEAMAEQWG
jgi:hypothetical protein